MNTYLKIFLAVILTFLTFTTGCADRTSTDEDVSDDDTVVEDTDDSDEPTDDEDQPEVSDEDLIRSYYSKIQDGKLEEAYAMKLNPSASLDTFEGWYKNTYSIEVRAFEEVAEHRHQFIVDLKEKGGDESSYSVVMEVKEGLLDTISSIDLAANEGVEVFVKVLENGKELYVKKDGTEILVEEIRGDEALMDYYFSKDSKYLVYDVGLPVKIYDIENEEHVFDLFGASSFGFTEDEKYFYACTSTGMLQGMMSIYNVPGFDMKRDLITDNKLVSNCYGYSQDTNSYKYVLTPNFQGYEQYNYYFDSDSVEAL